ncbi:MAG: hypothetical protein ONB16_09010 [candidate division KSB1 bacterium]|nr:hypothetical protein [candidate division KSB1 bacterium]MDZ7318107.1 hypothetical protein [candidate division KSB1 bacterium]MDZ7340511.1 hypothetical protein [candidate division KSB1 bacterium]
MVDINLIGDDQTQDDGDKGKQDFQNSFESEFNEPTPSTFGGRSGLDETEFPGMPSQRSSSKKTVYVLVFASIALLALVGYFFMKSGHGKRSPASVTDRIKADTSRFLSDADRGMMPATALSPVLRDRIVNTQRGINTITQIVNTIPANVNCTMVSYSDGAFLLEVLATGDPDITSLNSQLQRALAPAEVRLLSKDVRTVQRKQLRQALMSGDVKLAQDAGSMSISQPPAYLSSTELQTRLSQICQQAGLAVKQYTAGVEKTDGQFLISPIQFRAQGNKNSVLAFFQQVLNQNLNVTFSKIVLVGSNVDLTDQNITLVLNINLYRLI